MDISVTHEDQDRFRVRIGRHDLVVDQPDTGDAGPSPTDLFVASLAACVAHYARRFLERHEIDATGLRVDCGFAMAADRPARVSSIELTIELPDGFPDRLRDRLHAVVEHCTVHNSLVSPPDVWIELVAPDRVA